MAVLSIRFEGQGIPEGAVRSDQASVGINAEVMVMLVKRCADLIKHQNHDQ